MNERRTGKETFGFFLLPRRHCRVARKPLCESMSTQKMNGVREKTQRGAAFVRGFIAARSAKSGPSRPQFRDATSQAVLLACQVEMLIGKKIALTSALHSLVTQKRL